MTTGLKILEEQLNEELTLLEYPPLPWLEPAPQNALNVAIVGGGMAGLAASFALMREGVTNLQVYDASPAGYEGPWATCARMLILRSPKNLVGPALNLPKLTFQAWYIAQFGKKNWESLYKIPTLMWMDYLRWYKQVLNIPIQNDCYVTRIEPKENLIQLNFSNRPPMLAQKVVFATGRSGFGGLRIPDYLQKIPKKCYAHTSEEIDFCSLKGKNLIVIGTGASAFDASATALEAGAATVTMLSRRPMIPYVNKFASATYPGFGNGYYLLPDSVKIKIMEHAKENGTPPPFESLDRVKKYPNFRVITGIKIEEVKLQNDTIRLLTKKENLQCDFIISATGYEINEKKESVLSEIIDDILLWNDSHETISKGLGLYPYLGNHFEFLEKKIGKASYLRNIYCYNNSAKLSHGLTSSDIPDISTGATRLAKGIVADFFTQNWQVYFSRLQNYVKPEFFAKDYPFIH